MTEPTVPRQRATYSMPFKLDLVQRSLQPGACVALIARQNGINDNLLFTWRQRYRHLVDVPSDAIPAPAIISDDIVPVVTTEFSRPSLPALPAASAQSLPPDVGLCCEVSIGRARLKLSGNLTPAMLSALVRELKRGG
ncbi:transposase [Enterobacter hormaechei]|uniref:transposase n=1 Tax=Enterobacter hormaechei TaxID=158836 RepID=UPI0013EF5E0E|nr:transposase [Enterobacter hormaechei]KAF6706032.1 transposase [Enterobacter hormaechei]KAF6712815.1 transposase [Enterobacter hormaechei]